MVICTEFFTQYLSLNPVWWFIVSSCSGYEGLLSSRFPIVKRFTTSPSPSQPFILLPFLYFPLRRILCIFFGKLQLSKTFSSRSIGLRSTWWSTLISSLTYGGRLLLWEYDDTTDTSNGDKSSSSTSPCHLVKPDPWSEGVTVKFYFFVWYSIVVIQTRVLESKNG